MTFAHLVLSDGFNASLQRRLARLLITISLSLADKSYLHIGVRTGFSQTSKFTCNTYCVSNFVFRLLIAVILQRVIIKLYDEALTSLLGTIVILR